VGSVYPAVTVSNESRNRAVTSYSQMKMGTSVARMDEGFKEG